MTISSIMISRMLLEFRERPLGIDERNPRFSWTMSTDEPGQKQTAYQLLLAKRREELLEARRMDSGKYGKLDLAWDSGKTESGESVLVPYGGPALEEDQDYYWAVRVWDVRGDPSEWSPVRHFSTGLWESGSWSAKWIGAEEEPTAETDDAVRLFRTAFVAPKPVARAVMYVTALGLYEARLNGERVGDQYLTPGWTDYNRAVQYQTYDVTEQIAVGENGLGLMLASGWYAGHIGPFGKRQYGSRPAVRLQLHLLYEDGEREKIVTGGDWRTSGSGVIGSDMIMGETQHVGPVQERWDRAGFDDSHWERAVELPIGGIAIRSACDDGVRITETLAPVSVRSLDGNVRMIDMGQNMTGWAELIVSCQQAADEPLTITVRYAEMLNEDGTLYTTNLRSAKQTDRFLIRGPGSFALNPRFTFHGFRYVEVSGSAGFDLLEARGTVLHSALPRTGTLETSNPLVNKLVQNIDWGLRGNFISVPTDCPQRDERLGWTGDAQIFVRTATFFRDVAAFFGKWMKDVNEAQTEAGAFPDFVPAMPFTGSGTAGWSDAGVIIPWTQYRVYGDKRMVEACFDAMRRYIDCLWHESEEGLRPDAGYGDWLSIGADTPKDVIGTAYFAYSTKLLAQMASVLGRTEEEERLLALFKRIRTAFNRAYVGEDGRIKGETQTVYVLSLHMDLLPEELKPLAAARLVTDIEAKGWHLSTGFLGVGYLLPVLSEHGYTDTAYKLLLQESFPSWLYSILHGATTIWERWDGWTAHGGFQNPEMNSFNHYSLGSVGEWLFRYAAGIDVSDPGAGYRRALIRPHVGQEEPRLTWVRASYETGYGTISVHWRLTDRLFEMEVEIPVNTTATIIVPFSNDICEVASGTHVFTASMNERIVPVSTGSNS